MYQLNNSDIQDIEMWIRICDSIYDTYQDIKNTDTYNKRGTVEYSNLITRLKEELALENSLKSRLLTTSEKCNAVRYYVCEKQNQDPACIAISIANFQFKSLAITRRILNSATISTIEKGYEEPSNLEEAVDMLLAYLKVYLAIDSIKCANIFLAKELNNNNRKEVFNLYYSTCFGSTSVEQEQLFNNFDINGLPYVTYPILYKMFPGIEFKLMADIARSLGFDMILNELINRNNGIDEESKLLLSSQIESWIALLDEEEGNKLIALIDESLEVLKQLPYKERIVEILEGIKARQKKNREVIRSLTIK